MLLPACCRRSAPRHSLTGHPSTPLWRCSSCGSARRWPPGQPPLHPRSSARCLARPWAAPSPGELDGLAMPCLCLLSSILLYTGLPGPVVIPVQHSTPGCQSPLHCHPCAPHHGCCCLCCCRCRVKGRAPASWWRDRDSERLLEASHELGWSIRRGRAHSDILQTTLTDPR